MRGLCECKTKQVSSFYASWVTERKCATQRNAVRDTVARRSQCTIQRNGLQYPFFTTAARRQEINDHDETHRTDHLSAITQMAIPRLMIYGFSNRCYTPATLSGVSILVCGDSTMRDKPLPILVEGHYDTDAVMILFLIRNCPLNWILQLTTWIILWYTFILIV